VIDEIEIAAAAPARSRPAWRLVRRSLPARTGLAILVGFAAVAVFAPVLARYDPRARVGRPFLSPSADHWLGTNDIGQDIWAELIFGARISLGVALLVATLATGVAMVVGVLAGWYEGRVSTVLMRFVDVVLVLPFLPLMLLAAATYGPGIRTQVLVIGLVLWARPARVLRAATLAIRTAGHIDAAAWMGAPTPYILRRHVLPRIAPIIVTEFVRAANIAILLEAALAFLGLGDPVAKSWGTMLHYAYARAAFLTGAWVWWVVPPGLCIAAVVIGFALLGYSLEQGTDPRLRRKGWLGTS
jgi:ABC-type dipeptide/oligopeptide/nickel transport system permease subunit